MCLFPCLCPRKKSDQVVLVLAEMARERQAEEALRVLTVRLRADADTRKVA